MKYLKIFSLFLVCLPSLCLGKLLFLHIPKCGGTSIHSLLRNYYRYPDDFYSYRLIDKKMRHSDEPEDFIDALNIYPPITQLVTSGHFPFWFLQNQDSEFNSSFLFTTLRDPVDRVISHFFFKKKVGQMETLADVPPNTMCKMLTSDITLQGEELLNDCIRNLHRMDFIIFMDDFHGGAARLFKKLGFKRSYKVPHENVSPRSPVSPEDIEQIRASNELDIRLYEYAKTHLSHKSY